MTTHRSETSSRDPEVRRSRAGYVRKTIRDHLYGPTGSVILHLLIVFLLVRLVVGRPAKVDSTIELTYFEPKPVKLDPRPETPVDPRPDDDAPPQPEASDETPPVLETPDASPRESQADLEILDSRSPLIVREDWRPCTAEGRNKAIRNKGGKIGPQAEACVIRALVWLRDHQQADGSWREDRACGSDNRIALTGLALLCFLAHGETPVSTNRNFGVTVDKAIRYLIAQQQPDGTFGTVGPNGTNARGISFSYANNIAAYAVSEAYALTRVTALRAPMEAALRRVIDGQQDTGAFTYEYAKNGRRDTSVTGWSTQALKAGVLAKADVPGLQEALQKCAAAFKMNFDPLTGMFRYAPDVTAPSPPSPSMTGIGVLGLQLLKHGEDPEVDRGMAVLSRMRPDWEKSELGNWPLYAWYYVTQAKFHRSQAVWFAWWNDFAGMMISRQAADGHWDPPPGKGEESKYGAVYGTTFGALTLMVPYRFLPSYEHVDAQPLPLLPDPLGDSGIRVQDEI